MKFKRIFVLVLDSVGIGELPDAAEYGDTGANTIAHMAEAVGGLHLPHMQSLGYGNLSVIKGVDPAATPKAFQRKLKEISVGKDTMTGHWEIMGLKITSPFQTFTDTGFPQELLDELSQKTGRGILGNKSASGTEILDELGEEQMSSGDLIVYTSADSVLQIAAHEEIIPLEELYRCCEIAREITMKEEWKVGRIIARPYLGSGKGNFKRTSNRHDYALKPFDKTVLDYLQESGFDVISIGKINDIFDGEGITAKQRTVSNADGMEKTINMAKENFNGLLFLNLVDFDALYGHRRDPKGYAGAMEEFDGYLGKLLPLMREDDLLMLTADHGNDPIHHGTDHTREYVPLLMYSPGFEKGCCLPEGETFADIGATVAQNFGVKMPGIGEGLMPYLQ